MWEWGTLEVWHREYLISDDKSLVDSDVVCDFLSKSYWANHRTPEVIRKSIDNSVCYGIYHGDNMIGFARVVTDWATVYYLCDVFIDENHRGRGLGKKLVEAIIADFPSMMGLLGTKDAHGLYEQYGFVRDTQRFMRRRPR